VESVKGSDFCLLVTEPTPFGLNDLVLAVELLKKMRIPSGVVLNRAGLGDNTVQDYCSNENIPVLLTIPLDNGIARNYSRGITLTEGMPEWKPEFNALYSKIEALVSLRMSK
jgi:MinD superfamily P-loop ATPase